MRPYIVFVHENEGYEGLRGMLDFNHEFLQLYSICLNGVNS